MVYAHFAMVGQIPERCAILNTTYTCQGHVCYAVQREVEVEIEGVDKGGTFLGTLTLTAGPKPVNLGVTLLRSGLARLQPFFHDDAKGAREMIAAQDAAKQARLKVSTCTYVGIVAATRLYC